MVTNVVVQYNPESHLDVLLKMHASVWPRVLPFCILNVAWGACIYFCDLDTSYSFSCTDNGHVFMSLMVSYLIVSRLSNSLHRYNDGRKNLANLVRCSREIVLQSIAFTRFGAENKNSRAAMKWRVRVAKKLTSLLKVITTSLQYASSRINYWEKEQVGISRRDKHACLLVIGKSNERAPLILNYFLKSVIESHLKKLPKKMEVAEELALLNFTSDLMRSYENIRKDINTPYPFPLVQMTRTFLFVWVFTLPMALADDIQNLVAYLPIIFIITFGFLGLELVSIEMDDPYGNDANDFNVEGLMEDVYKDIEVYLYDVDGDEGVELYKQNSDFELTVSEMGATASERESNSAIVDEPTLNLSPTDDTLPNDDGEGGDHEHKTIERRRLFGGLTKLYKNVPQLPFRNYFPKRKGKKKNEEKLLLPKNKNLSMEVNATPQAPLDHLETFDRASYSLEFLPAMRTSSSISQISQSNIFERARSLDQREIFDVISPSKGKEILSTIKNTSVKTQFSVIDNNDDHVIDSTNGKGDSKPSAEIAVNEAKINNEQKHPPILKNDDSAFQDDKEAKTVSRGSINTRELFAQNRSSLSQSNILAQADLMDSQSSFYVVAPSDDNERFSPNKQKSQLSVIKNTDVTTRPTDTIQIQSSDNDDNDNNDSDDDLSFGNDLGASQSNIGDDNGDDGDGDGDGDDDDDDLISDSSIEGYGSPYSDSDLSLGG